MTNEKRIFELCGCVLDLIDELSLHDYEIRCRTTWIKDAILELREEIYTEEKNKGVNIYYD